MDNIIRNKVIIRECTHIQLHIWDDREKFILSFISRLYFFKSFSFPLHSQTFTLYFASAHSIFFFLLLLNKLVRDLYLVELTAHGFKEDNNQKPNPNNILS